MAHKTFSRIKNTLGQKTNLNKFKIPNSYNTGFLTTVKLEVSNIFRIATDIRKLHIPLYNQWVKEESKRKF